MKMNIFIELGLIFIAVLSVCHFLAWSYVVVLGSTYGKKPPQNRIAAAPTMFQQLIAAVNLALQEHPKAKRAQRRYHYRVAMTISALLVGFIFFAAETTFLPDVEHVHEIGVMIDVCAILIAAAFTVFAMRANKRWIIVRARAEILRQNAAIEEFLSAGKGGTVEDRYGRLAADLEAKMPKEPPALPSFIRGYWSDRCASIRSQMGNAGQAAGEFVTFFVNSRGAQQERWFAGAEKRMKGIAHGRGRWLGIFFAIAMLIALLKMWLVVVGFHDASLLNILSFGFLLCIGVSTALTGLYFNQNSRSLLHRYRIQLEKIKHQNAVLRAVGPATPNAQAMEEVISFETLMVEELIDWIEITWRDAIEFSPS